MLNSRLLKLGAQINEIPPHEQLGEQLGAKIRTSITLISPKKQNNELSTNYIYSEGIICKLRKEYQRISWRHYKLEAQQSNRGRLLATLYVSIAEETSDQTIAEQPLSL